jgi:threonine synthase
MDRLPRMVAVQPAGCDAITQAWQAGRRVQPISSCASAISGLQLTAPPDGNLVVRALHDSDGWAVSVPDEATYQAQADLASQEGVFVEPAAAITLAAVRADRASGRLQGHERVACWLTGIGFKDANAIQRMVEQRTVELIRAEDILSIGQG